MKILNKIIIPLAAILLLLISIWCITVFITGSKWYYNWQFEKNNTLENIQWTTKDFERIEYSNEDLDNITDKIINYLFNKESSMQIEINGHEFFSYQAIKHMEDVKTLYKNWTYTTIGFFILFIGCLIYIFMFYSKIKKVFFKYTIIMYISVLIILAIVAILMLIDFRETFYQFHHILFPNEQSFKDSSFGYVSNYDVDNNNIYINNLLLIKVLSIDVFLDAAWIIILYTISIMIGWLFITKKKK